MDSKRFHEGRGAGNRPPGGVEKRRLSFGESGQKKLREKSSYGRKKSYESELIMTRFLLPYEDRMRPCCYARVGELFWRPGRDSNPLRARVTFSSVARVTAVHTL